MSISVTQIPVGGFDSNFSYLVINQRDAVTAIVDPSGDTSLITQAISEAAVAPVAIWLTHTHQDHTDGAPLITDTYGELPIHVHQNGTDAVPHTATTHTFTDDDTLTLGDATVHVLYTPGHSDDSVCFYIEESVSDNGTPILISGDTLFVGGCGRTTPTRVKDLYESLGELRSLPEDTVVLPGHDYGSTPTSTIGREREENRFYQVANFTEFQKLRLG